MKKKRKSRTLDVPDALSEQHEQTQRLLAERIAYHRAKAEVERAQQERNAS